MVIALEISSHAHAVGTWRQFVEQPGGAIGAVVGGVVSTLVAPWISTGGACFVDLVFHSISPA